MAQELAGHQLTRIVAARLREYDYNRLVQRAKRAGAKTPSAYIRAAALAGIEFEMRSFEEQRELRNALIRIAMVLETYPATPLLTETLIETKAALGKVNQP